MAGPAKSSREPLIIEVDYLVAEALTVIRLVGSIDSHTYDRLESEFEKLYAKGAYRIVIDMSGVGYISSAGTGVIIGALGPTRSHNGDLVLINLASEVSAVLDLLGLTPMLSIAHDPETLMTFFPPVS